MGCILGSQVAILLQFFQKWLKRVMSEKIFQVLNSQNIFVKVVEHLAFHLNNCAFMMSFFACTCANRSGVDAIDNPH